MQNPISHEQFAYQCDYAVRAISPAHNLRNSQIINLIKTIMHQWFRYEMNTNTSICDYKLDVVKLSAQKKSYEITLTYWFGINYTKVEMKNTTRMMNVQDVLDSLNNAMLLYATNDSHAKMHYNYINKQHD